MTEDERDDAIGEIVEAVSSLASAIVEQSKASDLGPDYWEQQDHAHERVYDKESDLRTKLNEVLKLKGEQ